MINESCYWKMPLLRAATWLERLRVTDETIEKSLVRVEREVFVGFYAIRKLLPTFKVSPKSKQQMYTLQWFPAVRGKSVDYFNKHEIDDRFNLKASHDEQRDIQFLCNQIVHSYIFIISLREDGGVEGFFLASDTMRHRRVYFLKLTHVTHAFRTIGRDYPENLQVERDPASGQWIQRA